MCKKPLGLKELLDIATRESPSNALMQELVLLAFDAGKIKNDAEGKTVRIPTSEDEAALMILLGTQYLQQNAPHRLIDVA